MRASRLVSIVLLLQARGGMTAGELADALEVSVRTIYRDMTALGAAGIPVYGEPRRDGGYRLVDGYRTRLTGLTAEEARTLVVASVPAAAAALGLAEPAQAARLKLAAAAATATASPGPGPAELARPRVHVDPTPWGAVADPERWLPELYAAVWSDRLIRIRYGTSPHPVTVGPLGLVCKGTSWYLVATHGSSDRTYRVSRIREVESTAQPFERPEGFELVEHWRGVSQAYADTFARTTVRLLVRGAALDRVGWVQARAKSLGPPDPDGWVEATLVLEDDENARTEIRVLGDQTVVLEPASLRESAVAGALAFVAANTANTASTADTASTAAADLNSQSPGAQNTLPSGSAQTQ